MNSEKKQVPAAGNAFSGWVGYQMLKLTGWSVTGKLPPHPKMVIAVAPHTSNWDFFLGVAVLFYMRIKIRFLGKHTIFVPGIRRLLQWLGGIPVDRRNSHGIVEQICEHFDQNEQMILALSPEGTRSPIYPWKTGFLAIATKAEVPVLLIGFDFKVKKVIVGPDFMPSGNITDDMKKVYDFFKPIHAKYPHKVIYKDQ